MCLPFYRVEHRDTGKGPYHSRYAWESGPAKRAADILDSHCGCPRHPGPYTDRNLIDHLWRMGEEYGEEIVFGFKSLWHLRQWFTKDVRALLAALGFVVRRFDALDRVDGGRQSIAPRGSTLVETLDPVTLTPVQ